MTWRERADFVRRELQRSLDHAVDRAARRLLLGQDPRDVDEAAITAAQNRLARHDLITRAASELEGEEDAP